jgi:hypothetical protein
MEFQFLLNQCMIQCQESHMITNNLIKKSPLSQTTLFGTVRIMKSHIDPCCFFWVPVPFLFHRHHRQYSISPKNVDILAISAKNVVWTDLVVWSPVARLLHMMDADWRDIPVGKQVAHRYAVDTHATSHREEYPGIWFRCFDLSTGILHRRGLIHLLLFGRPDTDRDTTKR